MDVNAKRAEPRPPHQQIAATTPALRGPARSSQPPQIAAATPSNDEEQRIHPAHARDFPVACRREQLAARSTYPDMRSAAVKPIARDSGSQNTQKP